ncbi:hypothetical protein, partial [Collinsella sp. SGI.033]|uniref:hypothetical protein n=1 Tax=Collinsella sp. SGI.033 TaxID=3420552 RepID=UPI003D07D951
VRRIFAEDGEGARGYRFVTARLRELDEPVRASEKVVLVSVNLFFTSFAKQARRLRKGGFTGCANVFSPIPVTA